MSENHHRRLLTLDETSAILRKSRGQLRWMRHNRQGPPGAIIGGRLMFREGDVYAWIDAQFENDQHRADAS